MLCKAYFINLSVKIIYCLNHFLPAQVAGTEVYVFTLAKEMQKKGHEVLVLIPNFGKTIDESYNYENVRVIKFTEPTVLTHQIIIGKTIPDGVKNFVEILNIEKPSIIHFHTVGGSNGISLHHVREAKKSDAKLITTFHLAGYSCKTNNLFYKKKEPCNGYIDVLKCTKCVYAEKGLSNLKVNILFGAASAAYKLKYDTSKWNTTLGTAIGFPFIIAKLKKDLIELCNLSTQVVVLTKWYKKVMELNGISSNKLHYIPQGLAGVIPNAIVNTDTSVLKLVFVGRINESKGLHILLKAMNEIPSEKILLDIFGPISDEQYANEWKSFSSLMKNVRWMGIIQPQEILNTLVHYNVLCLPSVICEMSPLVIQEAFAAGIPVLASNVYGNAEQITDGENGWLFNFDDRFNLKNKLQQLIANPSLIEKAKANILPVKSFEIVADEHEKMYKEILETA
jgi:glycosyltransferase involved in cell wall biosynthesis